MKPYIALAEIYDRMMNHVNYKQWSEYILSLFGFSDNKIRSILEVSCGTGELLKYFVNPEYKLYATDLSIHMIDVLKKKPFVSSLNVFVSDACELSVKNDTIDITLMLYDSINYLLSEKSVADLFKNIHQILVPGGLFIFDTVTQWHCNRHFNNVIEEIFWDESGYQRFSSFDMQTKCQITDFKIFQAGKIYFEHHVQKIYDLHILTNILNKSGFEICAVYDNFSRNKMKKQSERIHLVCRKS